MKRIAALILSLVCLFPAAVPAQELFDELEETVPARVESVTVDETRAIPGTDILTPYQKLLVKIEEGGAAGKSVEIENDYVRVDAGDRIFVNRLVLIDGREIYTFSEPDRSAPLLAFTALFVLTIAAFGGRQGMRGLLSLVLSMVIIIYVLLPLMLRGYSPIAVSILVSSLITVLGSYLTHGVNRSTTSAVVGMIATVVVTGILAYVSVSWGALTGYADEAAIYLNLNSQGTIDLSGLLLGSIMIGLLGVLYDSAIGQSVAVDELWKAAPTMSRREMWRRATRIGREHIGALVTALAIAYVGAALPLLLLFYQSGADFMSIINREVFATEIMRTLVGSIGLVLAVPITTLVSLFLIPKGGSGAVSSSDHGHGGHFHHH